MLPQYIHWNLNPVICAIGGKDIRWYALFMGVALVFAWFFARWLGRREGAPRSEVVQVVFWMAVGMFVGGKLGHRLLFNTGSFSGFSSFGCTAGILLATWLYSAIEGRKSDMTFFWILDRVLLFAPFGCVLVRLGNFCNSELYGIPTSLPWGVVFGRLGDDEPRHPVQLYEAAAFLLLGLAMLWLYLKRSDRLPRGFLSGLLFVAAAAIRFLMEGLKDLDGSVARILCIFLFIMGAGTLVYSLIHRVPSKLRQE